VNIIAIANTVMMIPQQQNNNIAFPMIRVP